MSQHPPKDDERTTTVQITTPPDAAPNDQLLSRSLPTHPAEIDRNAAQQRLDDRQGSETSAQSLPPRSTVSPRPPLNRGQSQIQMALNGSANFVGWNDTDTDLRRNWGSKRLRFLAKKYNLNQHRALSEARNIEPALSETTDHPVAAVSHWNQSQPSGQTETNFSFPSNYGVSPSAYDAATPGSISRSLSQASESCGRPRSERRESAARVAVSSAANVAKRGVIGSQRMHRVRLSSRQSFDMDLSESDKAASSSSLEVEQDFGMRLAGTEPPRRTGSPIAEESPSDMSFEHEPQYDNVQQRRTVASRGDELEMSVLEPSAYSTALDELPAAKSSEGKSDKMRPKLSTQERIDSEDLFFEFSADDNKTRSKLTSVAQAKDRPLATVMHLPKVPMPSDIGDGRLHIPIGRVPLGVVHEEERPEVNQPDRPLLDGFRSFTRSVPRYPLLKQTSVIETSKRSVVDVVLGNLGHHSGRLFIPRFRRYRGLGVLSSLYDGSLHRGKIDALNPLVRDVIEAGSDERPLFTWWVTTVQVIVCVVSLLFYGLGPTGWERVEMKDEVIDVTLAMRQVSYYEPVNLWIGPRFADLIRLGAKYSPCMRREPGLWKLIMEERARENGTGCCVFNDGTGCYQTGQSSCPRTLATWHKWSRPKPPTLQRSKSDSYLLNSVKNATLSRRRGTGSLTVSSHSWRTAGAVCGQDPDFCMRPSSVIPYEWPDDLTRWPICEQHRHGAFLPPHMKCQVTGRPCCIQMQGQCRIATREYCAFVKGHFHENATLCSQVNCFSDICGMLPFVRRDSPDQSYRMFFSLFLHAGIIHVLFTVFVQMWLMLDLEMLIGWKRMAILYIGSGIGGNIASAIFVPYSPEVGPSGSHLGIMAALVVDLHHHRHIIVRPRKELGKHMVTVLALFMTGLLPWVDNWAHLFGFIFGLLITIVTFPYLNFESPEKPRQGCRSSLSRRHFAILTALILCVLLYILLGYVYFHNVEVNCPGCQYFNCINIRYFTGSNHFCDNTGQKLSQWLPI
ncbi:hypothetical protein Q1695_003152 [Nippostrongylus brasiliensis]|nr:hypothetical protein Q1695_003152 [Nippostrongylus brasiliensis]